MDTQNSLKPTLGGRDRMDNKQVLDIAGGLVDKTLDGKANWLQYEIAYKGAKSTSAYCLVLPRSRVEIIYREFSSAPDDYIMRIKNRNGNVVASISSESGDEEYRLLDALYATARSQFLRWEETIDDLMEAIDSDEKIGLDHDPNSMPF